MKKEGRWTLAAVAVASWAALYVYFWYQRSGCFDLFDRSCIDAPMAWLERLVSFWWVKQYQELAAAVIALIAAIVVGRPVYLQLRETRRQSSAAAIPSLRGIASEVEEHCQEIAAFNRRMRQLGPLMDGYDDAGNVHVEAETWLKDAYNVLAAVSDFRKELQKAVDRSYAVNRQLELQGLEISERFHGQFRLLLNSLWRSVSAVDASASQNDLSREISRIRAFIQPVANEWGHWHADYASAANERVRQVWAKIRFLEKDATEG